MNKHPLDIEDENNAIASAIQRVAARLNKTPTQQEYKRERTSGEPSLEQITYRFGKWSSAVEFAGLAPNPFQQPPRQPEITKQELVAEFIRVANSLKCVPGMNQFRANARYSWTPYKTNWGSWKNAVEFILTEHAEQFSFALQQSRKEKKEARRRHLNFACPLQYEPQNEYETIALFCYLAEELGFKILKIQSEFPDAIVVQNGKETAAEFEYLSSNYVQHCHPVTFDGIVICWRKDIELAGIRTISLEDYLRKRQA